MAYDGTGYTGWQAQPNGKTVQQVMEHALTTMVREDVAVTGAGRTDTGVHASFFVAHFDTSVSGICDTEQFIYKLNRFLPPDIVIYKIQEVHEEAHARFSATFRTYHYHISRIKPLFKRSYSYFVHRKLDTNEINSCCEIIKETTDFTSFSKLHTDVKTNNCTVMCAEWKSVDEGYLFEIKADRFLRNMVRSLVGTLLDVGLGKSDRNDFLRIIKARDRGQAGQSVPAKGLFLVDIGYDF